MAAGRNHSDSTVEGEPSTRTLFGHGTHQGGQALRSYTPACLFRVARERFTERSIVLLAAIRKAMSARGYWGQQFVPSISHAGSNSRRIRDIFLQGRFASGTPIRGALCHEMGRDAGTALSYNLLPIDTFAARECLYACGRSLHRRPVHRQNAGKSFKRRGGGTCASFASLVRNPYYRRHL